MKTNILKLKTAVTVCATAVVMASCCNNTPVVVPDTPLIVKDTSVGTFIVKNLSTQATIKQNEEVINRDTFLIAFKPNKDYSEKKFTIECNGLRKFNDSIFILPDEYFGSKIEDGKIIVPREPTPTIDVKISARIGEDDKDYDFLRADTSFVLNVATSYAIIPLCVDLTSDLKSLVDVEVGYTDVDGKELRYRVNDEEWVYTNGSFEHATFSLNTRLLNIKDKNVSTTFSVFYTPKKDIKYDKETYWLAHAIGRGNASVFIPSMINIPPINNSSDWHGLLVAFRYVSADVAAYLDELSKKPYERKFNISNGKVTEVKD